MIIEKLRAENAELRRGDICSLPVIKPGNGEDGGEEWSYTQPHRGDRLVETILLFWD
jgi:hypothetical protein